MFFHARSFIASLGLILITAGISWAEDPPKANADASAPSVTNSLFGLASIAPAAADLRKAGEAFERFGTSVGGASGIVNSIAKMSSEFDPFGYKTAFRTIGQQMQTIQHQNKIIRELQEREIERLRNENIQLKKERQKPRKRNRNPK